jgi:hypothetical protein
LEPVVASRRNVMPTATMLATPLFPSVVIPPGGTDVGTRRVFSEDLRDKGSGQPVGQHSGTCTLVRQPAFYLCHAGWTLLSVGPGKGKSGTFVAGGLLDFGPTGAPPFMVAVFGGTGDFDKVRGEIAARPVAGGDWEYTLELVP